MKRVTSAFALFVPLALVWACGSSGEDGNGGNGANGSGASAGVGAMQGLGGEGSVVGGDNSGATSNTGGSIAGSLGTGGTVVGAGGTLGTELCGDAGCVCSNGLDDDEDGVAEASCRPGSPTRQRTPAAPRPSGSAPGEATQPRHVSLH